MSPDLLPWVVVALSISLVGAAVLLLALDTRIRRGLERERSLRCNSHGEWIYERDHQERLAARVEQARADQFGLDSLRERSVAM